MKEKAITLGTIAVRGTAFGLRIAGQPKAAEALYALADLIDAGVRVDEHMDQVATLLESRELTDADFDDVMARIQASSADLQSVTR